MPERHAAAGAATSAPGQASPQAGYDADAGRAPYLAWGALRTVLTLLFFAVGVGYMLWRLGTLNMEHPVFSWLVYLAEAYGLAAAAMHVFMVWRLTEREAPPPPAGRSVDVFVTCYNEPEDMVRRTLLLARDMDYPHQTWLLDDGNRAAMRALAGRLGVRYLARTHNTHAKAGNLNHALEHSSGELIAIFDADHAPQRHFLVRTLGYFLDEKVAFVQTPQEFFNLNSFQHRLRWRTRRLWTEQSLFFKVLQRGKDYWNAAFFCGTCAVVRRSALREVGGFAVGTVTEDLHTSLKLHKAGFRSVYHHEPLAFGIAPAQITPFLAQRVRWGQGAMQVLRKENIFFTRRLTLAQKINYLASISTYFDGWQKGLYCVAPAVVLLTGWLPIDASGWVFLCWFLPYYLLSAWVFEELGRGYGGILYTEQYNFARFAAFAWATLGLLMGPRKFRVTNKALSHQSTNHLLMLPQLLVLGLNLAAVALALAWSAQASYLPAYALYFNLGWAAVNLACGLAVMRHVRSTERCLRAEYRFPLPLPLLPAQDGGMDSQALTIDNISSSGCHVFGMLPPGLRRGQVVQARIALPSGPLPVRLMAVADPQEAGPGSHHRRMVGCRFLWEDAQARDTLDLFLYGNDLQWQLQELQECSIPPSGWLRRNGLHRMLQACGRAEARDWAICEVDIPLHDDAGLQPGLVPLPAGERAPRQLVFYSDIQEGAALLLRIQTRSGERRVFAQAGATRRLSSTAGTVYVCTLNQVRQQAIAMPDAALPASPKELPCESLAT